MDTKKLDERLSVREQLEPDDVVAAAKAGFRTIVNNRPDGEQPDQPTSAEVEAAAKAAGLAYRHIPVVPGQFTDDSIAAFEVALAELPKPVLAFCRTGTRSATLWGLVSAPELGAQGAIDAAASAGCDIAQARPRLEQRAG